MTILSRLKKFDIEGVLSLILDKFHITDYCDKVSFAAHLMAGIIACFLGWPAVLIWAVYSIYSEFILDGWYVVLKDMPQTAKFDLYCDLISKLGAPLIYLLIVACRPFM